MSTGTETSKKTNSKKRTITIFLCFLVLLVALPFLANYLGKKGVFLPKNSSTGALLQEVSITDKPEFDTTETITAAPTNSPEEPPETATVNASSLKVRSGPGSEYSEIALLAHNDVVEIINKDYAPWFRVKTNSGEGYVSSDFLTIN